MNDSSILVVDDEPEVCAMITDWLSDDGLWTVDYTTEPQRALEQVACGRYDVMVTDLRMPDMDGLELARQARGLCPDLGVVAITGYASVPSSVAALREGFVDYLQKPFRGEDVRAAVHRAMARRREADVMESATDDVTCDNALLSATNQELQRRLDLASRELTLLQHRLAGHVADLKARCDSADTLDGQRQIPELAGMSLVLLRNHIPGDEHAIMILDRRPARCLAVGRIEGDEIAVHWCERKLSRGVVRAVAKRKQTALIEDAANSPVMDDLSPWITCQGSVVVLPLVGNDRVQGVAVVRRDEVGQAFGETEIKRVLQHCSEIGRALDVALSIRSQQSQTYRTLKRLVQAMENQSEQTRGHSRRVAHLAVHVARQLGLQGQAVETLDLAGRLHDIGKVLLPQNLLGAVGPLSADQMEQLAAHKEMGWQLLRPVAFLQDAATLVRHHHDVCGNDEAPPELMALAAAETFDELTHDGPHGEALTPEEALVALHQAGAADRLIKTLARVALTDD